MTWVLPPSLGSAYGSFLLLLPEEAITMIPDSCLLLAIFETPCSFVY